MRRPVATRSGPSSRVPLTLIASGALLAATSRADNGAIAVALPIGDVTIDGDLSDWPVDLEAIPITVSLRDNAPRDDDDLSATFRAAYRVEEPAILVGVTVTDEAHLADDDGESWIDHDLCILYVDPTHSPRGSGSLAWGVCGDRVGRVALHGAWDPLVKGLGWHRFDHAVTRRGSVTTYELRVPLDAPLDPPRSVGLDLVIVDRDPEDRPDNGSYLAWEPTDGKGFGAGRLGDLLLMERGLEQGVVRGLARWDDAEGRPTIARARIRVTSLDHPAVWVQTELDDDGRYEVTLPPGAYRLGYPYGFVSDEYDHRVADGEGVVVTIVSREPTDAPDMVLTTTPPPDVLGDEGMLFDEYGFDDALFERFVDESMRHYHVSGASIAVVVDGALRYHGVFGVKNELTGEPVEDDTPFEAASITKIVFAFCVNRLAERGEIDLDRPLHEYLPFEEIAHDERYKLITARHVLTHQTGFPNWAWSNDGGRLEILFTPGTSYGYSGEGFEYLGRVVAHLQERPLEQVVVDEVLESMDFEGAWFSQSDRLQRIVAHGHTTRLPSLANLPQRIGVAHSMHTEARALSGFMISLMEQRGLSPDGYERMLTRWVATPEDPDLPGPRGFGLGFQVTETRHGKLVGHGGNNGDFMCTFDYFPSIDPA